MPAKPADCPEDEWCAHCSMRFSSRTALETHRANFCKGSVLHLRLIDRHRDKSLLTPEAVSAHLAGEPRLSEIDGLTVDELRKRMARDAQIAERQRAEAAEEAKRAAAHVAMQKAQAEAQKREAEARILAQRSSELRAQVERRAAEKTLRGAELRSEADVRVQEVELLREQESRLAAQRQQAETEAARVKSELAALQGGHAVPAERAAGLLQARDLLNRSAPERLSSQAAAMRSTVARRQDELLAAKRRERQRLLSQQQRIESEISSLSASLPAQVGAPHASQGGGGDAAGATLRTAHLLKAQEEDERRIARLTSQIQQAKSYDSSDAARFIDRIAEPEAVAPAPAPLATATGAAREEEGSTRTLPPALEESPECPVSTASYQVPTPTPFREPASPLPPPFREPASSPPRRAAHEATHGGAEIASQLDGLRTAYASAGGANPELVQLMSKLQADARALAEGPSTGSGGGLPGTVPPEVRRQMEAMDRALAAREEEARELQGRLAALKQHPPPRCSGALSPASEPREPPAPLAPATLPGESVQERELRELKTRQELSLAQLRHEREMLEEQARLKKVQEQSAREEEQARLHADHAKWVADQKRQLLEAKVQREIARNGATNLASTSLPSGTLPGVPYSADSGFVVFWDFVSALPRHVAQCNLVYALYDGPKMRGAVKSLPVCDCEPEPGGLARALFAIRRQFMHTPAHQDLQLVVEVQHVIAPAGGPGAPPKTASVGWTSVPLFEPSLALRAGFWRAPLYRPPINASTPVPERTPLDPMSLFFRVVLTADMERLRAFAVDPDATAAAYVPAHGQAREEEGVRSQSRPLGLRAAANAIELAEGLLSSARRPTTQASGASGASFSTAEDEQQGIEAAATASGQDGGRPGTADSLPVVALAEEKYDEDLGIEVRPQRLRDWRPDDPVSFIASMREKGVNPLHVHFTAVSHRQRLPGSLASGAGQLDASGSWTVDWVGGVTLRPPAVEAGACLLLAEVFDMAKARAMGYEPPTPASPADIRAAGPPGPSVVAWGLMNLLEGGAEGAETIVVRLGSQTVRMLPPPVQLQSAPLEAPPGHIDAFGELQVQLRRGIPAPVQVEQEAVLRQAMEPAPVSPAATPPADNLGVPEAAWLNSDGRSAEAGAPGTPKELVLDAARWLPDNLVVCRARLALLDAQGQTIREATGWCSVLSDARSPKFDAKLLLPASLPLDGTIVVSLVAMEEGVAESRQLGFAALALFSGGGASSEPPGDRAHEGALNSGAFQLPIMIGHPEEVAATRDGLTSEAVLYQAPRIPCASVLVRLKDAGGEAPPPAYSTRSYDSSRTIPAPHETALYRVRLQREPLVAFDAIRREADRRGESAVRQDEAERWMRTNLSAAPKGQFDLTRFAKYNPIAGLQVCALNAHNLPHPALSFGVVSLVPPGTLYRSPPQPATGVRFTDDFEPESSLRSPVWKGGAGHLQQVPFDETTLVVVEVRMLKKLQPVQLEPQGWSVVPAFYGGDVNTGIFQLPLYNGSPPRELLAEMKAGDWRVALEQALASRAIKLVESASVEVSIQDAQRFGEYDNPELRPAPDRSLLPARKVKAYLKDASSKPISSLLGPEETLEDFRAAAVRAFRQALGVKS